MRLPAFRSQPSWSRVWISWMLLLTFVGIIVDASRRPPSAIPETAPARDFSSARAMHTLEQFTKRPHPVGSVEHERVRQYLLWQMQALGLEAATETRTGVEGTEHRVNAARFSNLVGRLRGTNNTRAVVLVAHYDTVERAPGAGDDGGGIATILETVRAVKAGPQLRNDLIVLLTDGEELGLLGARVAVTHDMMLRQVGVLLNFEGRGDRGPAQMFETSSGNGELIRNYVRAAPYKTGSSLLYTIYKHLPNDTDYTVFKAAGIAGLNFAWAERWEAYHSQLDTTENLDQRGLQQEGSNALALTRNFGNLDLDQTRAGAGDEVYFNLFGMWMLHYPGGMVAPLAGLLTLILAWVLVGAVRSRRMSITALLSATGVSLLLVLMTTLTGVLTFAAEHQLVSGRMQLGDTPANTWFFLASLLFETAVWLAIFRAFRTRLGLISLIAGGCLFAWVVSMLMTLALPLASYLLCWPLLFSTLGLALTLRRSRDNSLTEETATAWLCALPTLILISPTIYFFFVALFLAPPVAVVCGLALGLGLLLMTPLASLLVPSSTPVWLLLLAGVAAIAAGRLLSKPSALHPQPDTLLYRIDADTGRAQWASLDKAVDPWTSRLMTSSPKQGRIVWPGSVDLPGLVTDAPAITLAPPELKVLQVTKQGDVRSVRVRINSGRKASWLRLQLPSEVEVVGASVDGEAVQDWPRPSLAKGSATELPWAFNLYGYNESGVELTLRLRGESCSATLTDLEYGLPAMVEPRPLNRMAWYGSDYTVVTRRVALC